MPRQRRSMGSVSEAFEHGSNSSDNGVDHANVTFGRNSRAVNLGRPTRRSARLAQRRRATTNVIDLESDPINLDDEVINGPLTLQNTGSGDIPRNIDLNESGGNENGEELEEVNESSSLFPPINIGQIPSSGMFYFTGAVQLGHPPHLDPIPITVPQPRARRGSRLDQLIERRFGIPPPAQNTYSFDDGRRRIVTEAAVLNASNIMRMGGVGYEFLIVGNRRLYTGLREEVSLMYLKQRTYPGLKITVPSEGETCCICQEEFVNGVKVGELDCGHFYHTECITEWLKQKNLCPICKTTALVTSGET